MRRSLSCLAAVLRRNASKSSDMRSAAWNTGCPGGLNAMALANTRRTSLARAYTVGYKPASNRFRTVPKSMGSLTMVKYVGMPNNTGSTGWLNTPALDVCSMRRMRNGRYRRKNASARNDRMCIASWYPENVSTGEMVAKLEMRA